MPRAVRQWLSEPGLTIFAYSHLQANFGLGHDEHERTGWGGARASCMGMILRGQLPITIYKSKLLLSSMFAHHRPRLLGVQRRRACEALDV